MADRRPSSISGIDSPGFRIPWAGVRAANTQCHNTCASGRNGILTHVDTVCHSEVDIAVKSDVAHEGLCVEEKRPMEPIQEIYIKNTYNWQNSLESESAKGPFRAIWMIREETH